MAHTDSTSPVVPDAAAHAPGAEPTGADDAATAAASEAATAAASEAATEAAEDPAAGTDRRRRGSQVRERWAAVREALVSSRAGQWWQRTEAPGVLDWLLLGALLAVAYVTFLYGDVRATFEHSFNFLDSVLQGRPRDFYTISIEHTSTGHPAVYDIPLYAIFALWNLPTYVIHHLTGLDYLNSTPALLWLKLMLVLAAFLAARQVEGLARQLGVGPDRSRWAAFYFLSSMAVFMPVFVVVQYDVILVVVMLAALRSYLNGSMKGFVGWFVLANTLKLFSIFIFIPLLLLREKRLRVVLGQLIIGMVGLVACRLLYHGDPGYAAATGGFTSGMLQRLIATSIGWIGGGAGDGLAIPLFVVTIVAVTIGCYVWRTDDEEHLGRVAVYVSTLIFLAFMVLAPLNPYWIMLVAPFMVLVVFLKPQFIIVNSLLELFISGLIVLIYTRVGYSMYNSEIFSRLLLPHLVSGASQQRFPTPNDVFIAVGLGGGTPFLIGFLVACALAFLVINVPVPLRSASLAQAEAAQRLPRSVAWFRLLGPLAFTALLLVTYFVPAVPIVYSSVSGPTTPGSANILGDGAVVEHELTLDQTTDVRSVAIGFDGSQVQWLDSSLVDVSIEDAGSGSQVFATSIPANSLGNKLTEIPTPGLVLTAGQTYRVRITSHQTEGGTAHVLLVPGQDDGLTREDGAVADGDLAIVVNGYVRGS